jgi:hypothetical protein
VIFGGVQVLPMCRLSGLVTVRVVPSKVACQAGFVEDVVVVVAEEHEVRDRGVAVGVGDDVVDFAVGPVAAGISAPAVVSVEHRSSESS